MDSWERLDETSPPNKENFYSCLNMEDITDIDYKHAKRLFREFKINNLGHYRDLYVKSDTLLLIYLKILEINALKYMSLILLIFYHYQDLHDKLA